VNTYTAVSEVKMKELNTTKIQTYNTKQRNGPVLLTAEKRQNITRLVKKAQIMVLTAAQKILCCWFPEACETMEQVPQYTGRLC
jgi:hypothetical protein